MPWKNGAAFASKHNNKLHGHAATVAAKQATAMVKAGVPEGEAIATANKTGNRMAARATKPTPPSAAVKDVGDATWGNEKFRSAHGRILYDHPRSPKKK
jgi:hypothetical protein